MPGFSSRLEYMHNCCMEAMELAERADLYSKQVAKGGSSLGQKQKTAKKGNKKGWRGKGYGKKVLYPLLQAPKGTREKGQRGRTKARGHREGP